ncbi:UNVERIFIED_CONTAM: hypothetical protein Slati_4184000 [Sesamum latifolium]|uniref:Uncharacterized protein n=1 Tax=Sesamum latifolium TaxID=2727402 RepID=A0AAW2T9H0_9LAMI
MEDAQAAKKESRGKKRKETKEETPSKKPRVDMRDKKPPFQRVNTVYTPLTVPITQALMAVEGKGLLTRPRSWKDSPQRPKSDKFCHFHNDYGHTTKEYRYLKNEIERLIQNGYLQEYVCCKKARGAGPYQKQEGDKGKEVKASSPEHLPKEEAKYASGSKGEVNDPPLQRSYMHDSRRTRRRRIPSRTKIADHRGARYILEGGIGCRDAGGCPPSNLDRQSSLDQRLLIMTP